MGNDRDKRKKLQPGRRRPPDCPCGKRSYATRRFVATLAAAKRKETGEAISWYRCPQSGAYHIGHEKGTTPKSPLRVGRGGAIVVPPGALRRIEEGER